jgi:micrococcal nuclease
MVLRLGQYGECLSCIGRFEHPTAILGQRAPGVLAHNISLLDNENRVRRTHRAPPPLVSGAISGRACSSTVSALTGRDVPITTCFAIARRSGLAGGGVCPWWLVALLVALLDPQLAAAQQRLDCTVAHVTDGDTFWARCPQDLKVRLLLIDAPERDQFPFGREAKAAIETLLRPAEPVALEFDVERTDRYGRALAYAFLPDGRMVNEEMARAGYATALVYPPNVRYVERIRRAVMQARAAQRGLWAQGGFACAPKAHRQRRC